MWCRRLSHEELEPFSNITDVIKAYEQGLVDYSVVPVENSIEGSVHETLDYLFHQARIQAVAEIVQPIHQQLMAVPGQSKIEKIFSHPQALAQGKKFIDEHYPDAQLEVTASTAYAARYVSEHPEQPFAAIAPQKFCWRIRAGANRSRYSRNGSQFHSLLGVRSQGTANALECKC